jgi:peptidoglycan/LPS O-acetylase OafA/YrhL
MVYAGWLAASIFAAGVILQLITGAQTLMHRILENPALVYLGKISYGLYVWHFPILQVMVRYRVAPPDHYWPFWISVFPVAIASYYLIEFPCLQLKKRFQKI